MFGGTVATSEDVLQKEGNDEVIQEIEKDKKNFDQETQAQEQYFAGDAGTARAIVSSICHYGSWLSGQRFGCGYRCWLVLYRSRV